MGPDHRQLKKCFTKIVRWDRPCGYFLHDSLHTLEHILFELKESYNYIPKWGFLIVDDINIDWIRKVNQEIKSEKSELFYDLLVLKK